MFWMAAWVVKILVLVSGLTVQIRCYLWVFEDNVNIKKGYVCVGDGLLELDAWIETVVVINPITYGILPFRQLRGGLFGPDPENKVTVNGLIWNLAQIMVWMILVNMQNFKLMAFLLLEIWRHKNFLSKMERVIVIRYLPPGFKQNSTKITFYAWKHLFWHKVIPPSVFPLFSSKNKNFIGSIFRDVSFQKQLQQPPW